MRRAAAEEAEDEHCQPGHREEQAEGDHDGERPTRILENGWVDVRRLLRGGRNDHLCLRSQTIGARAGGRYAIPASGVTIVRPSCYRASDPAAHEKTTGARNRRVDARRGNPVWRRPANGHYPEADAHVP